MLLTQEAAAIQSHAKMLRVFFHFPKRFWPAFDQFSRKAGQRIEQMPVRVSEVAARTLRTELEETARLFAPALDIALSVPDMGTLQIDHGIFLNVAENLIGNAARFARTKVEITLAIEKEKSPPYR